MPIIDSILGILAPHSCLVCQEEGKLICDWCSPDACLPVPDRCYKCFSISTDSKVCTKCRRKTKLGHVWMRTEYEGAAKELLHKFKFERARSASKTIAGFMYEVTPYFNDAILVSVPIATSRLRLRGYDQSKLLARELSKFTGLPYANFLARSGQARQVGTKRTQRVKQLEGVFRPVNIDLVKGSHIILVDDVVTTGATLEESAKVLKQAGAKKVDAVVFAQTR